MCTDCNNSAWRHVLLHSCSGSWSVDVVYFPWTWQSALGSGVLLFLYHYLLLWCRAYEEIIFIKIFDHISIVIHIITNYNTVYYCLHSLLPVIFTLKAGKKPSWLRRFNMTSDSHVSSRGFVINTHPLHPLPSIVGFDLRSHHEPVSQSVWIPLHKLKTAFIRFTRW